MGLKQETRNRGFKIMQMCKMFKSNNRLKVLRIETEMELPVPEGPHNELTGSPWPHLMTP